jgi:hypothetical protein
MKNKYLKIFFATILLGLLLASCNESEKNDGIDFLVNDGTKSEAFAGDWYVRIQDKASGDILTGYGKINTFNTTENEKNVFWINDDSLWGFQIKSKGNDDLTFASTDPKSLKYGEDATITAGKILKGKALSKTKNVTDSIYMEIEFVSDPGVTYIFSGHKRTRWPEDDY